MDDLTASIGQISLTHWPSLGPAHSVLWDPPCQNVGSSGIQAAFCLIISLRLGQHGADWPTI